MGKLEAINQDVIEAEERKAKANRDAKADAKKVTNLNTKIKDLQKKHDEMQEKLRMLQEEVADSVQITRVKKVQATPVKVEPPESPVKRQKKVHSITKALSLKSACRPLSSCRAPSAPKVAAAAMSTQPLPLIPVKKEVETESLTNQASGGEASNPSLGSITSTKADKQEVIEVDDDM